MRNPDIIETLERQRAFFESGETLEVWLDDGEPADNVPRSTKLEGNKVLNQEKVGEYWTVLIEKA